MILCFGDVVVGLFWLVCLISLVVCFCVFLYSVRKVLVLEWLFGIGVFFS